MEVGFIFDSHFIKGSKPIIGFVEGQYLNERYNPRIYDKNGKFFGSNFDTSVIVIGKIKL
jgi:hypothetical protein